MTSWPTKYQRTARISATGARTLPISAARYPTKLFARPDARISRASGRRWPRHGSGTFPPRSVHLQMQLGMRGGSQVVAATKAPSLLLVPVPPPPCVQPARESSPRRPADVTLSRLGAPRDMGIKGRGERMGCQARYADASHPPPPSVLAHCPAHWLPPLCPPKDATTRTLNPLVHCLPSPAFPPWAGDVASPLSSEGAPAETSRPHFKRSRVMRAPSRRRLPPFA